MIFAHSNTYANANKTKLSADKDNKSYTIGFNGSVTNGTPDIKWQQILFIKDTKQIWTHGQLYNCASNITSEDFSDNIDDIDISRTFVQFVSQYLSDTEQEQARHNIGAASQKDLTTYVNQLDWAELKYIAHE